MSNENELSNSLLKEIVKDILERDGEKEAQKFLNQLKKSFKSKDFGDLGFELEDLMQS